MIPPGFVSLFILGFLGFTADEGPLRLAPAAAQVARFEKIEFTIAGAIEDAHPYDPDEIDLRLEIEAPAGKRFVVPAFFFQPFERRPLQRENAEWLYPTGKAVWKARFTPTEVGRYQCVAALKNRGGEVRSAARAFLCVTGKPTHGFIHVSKRDPRYLEFDDGTPYFAVGQNAAFVTNSYKEVEKLEKLGANGANFVRVWACAEDWAMAIEARKSAFGRSWDWRPPIVIEPGHDGYHFGKLCLKLSGDADTKLDVHPARPVALRPDTKYRFTGKLIAEPETCVVLDLNGPTELKGKREGATFERAFTSGADQWWLVGPTFRLAEKGTAYLKDLSLTEAAGGPELLEEADLERPILGSYNQPDCFMLDQIVAAAEKNGVYLQITLLTRDHYMASLRQEKSAAYDRAIRSAQRLARYAAARWGYSPNVLAWEYFNEIDPGLPTDRFYTELGQTFDQWDGNHHLRATSAWHSPDPHDRCPALDTANLHHYLRPASGDIWKDEVASVQDQWRVMQKYAAGKPIFFAEFGITDNNWQHAPELNEDKTFHHLHDALWASALTGFASTVCHWYWDDIHQHDYYPLYQPVARFVADIPWTTGNLRPASTTGDDRLRTVGLMNDNNAYLWIGDKSATWWNVAMTDWKATTITGASVSVQALKPGRYRVEWWDTYQGTITNKTEIDSRDSVLKLSVPAFEKDLACKIIAIEQ